MASKSKAAQEQLAELEKLSAPFTEQLVEAAKFVGVELDATLHNLCNEREDRIAVQYFGREEWLLRWLLKKLHTPSDSVPRKTAASWSLLLHLLRTIPVANCAKILTERGFILSLRLALEEVAHDAKNISVPARKQEKVEKASKKRKRSGETVSNPILIESTALPKLLGCIYAAVGYITDASNILSATAVMGIKNARGPVFSAEYMQTVIRTPAEEAAKILGAWMDLCDTTLQSEVEGLSMANWLAPFIEIWSPQPVDPTAYLHFSLHCTRPILSLLCGFKGGKYPTLDWTIQLEQLIARNVINPAKSEFAQDPESLLLSTLTTTSVLQDLSNAPRLFEIAIRSIKPHGSRRRRGSDDAWLLHVFKTLKESLPPKASKDGKVISAMLHLATEHKVLLDLPVLRAITSEFALPQVEVAWELVATMIKLDANVFLIADTESKDNLLDNLLARITEASVAETWPEISQQVVAEVVVPLMNEFAKARDLSSFMRHWYAQIVLFEQLRAESDTEIIAFCAWEDEALHVQLRKLFEASLTIQQIEQLVDWLSSEVNSSPNAVCVLLDAVAGSLVGEAVIDAVGLKLFHMIFDNGTSETLNERYKWRAFRVLSRTIDCTTYTNVDEVLLLWKQASQPFDSYSKDKFLNGLRQTNCQDISQLEIVERFRLICSIWSAPAVGTKDELVKPVLLKSLRSLSSWITDFSSNVVSKVETENEAFDTECNKLVRTRGAITWSLLKCIFIDYPKVLVIGLELGSEELKALLQNILWLSSASTPDRAQSDCLKINHGAFPSLWMSALDNESILNSNRLTELIIDTMLCNPTNYNNPMMHSAATNKFSVQALLATRMENFNKKQREAILKGWLPTGDAMQDEQHGFSYANTLDPAVLALKLKVTEYAMFYEGMKFKEFVHLATAFSEVDASDKETSLALLKELCQKTFEYIHTIPKEPRNQKYILSAFETIGKKVEKATKKSKHKLTAPFIVIFAAVLKVILNAKISVISQEDVEISLASFNSHLLDQLKDILPAINKGSVECDQDIQLTILSIVDALSISKLSVLSVEGFRKDISTFVSSDTSKLKVGVRLGAYIFTLVRGSIDEPTPEADVDNDMTGDIKTRYGRQSIILKSNSLTAKDNKYKLGLLDSIFGLDRQGIQFPDKLLAARQIIVSLEDTGKSDENEESFDLAEAYSTLCNQLWKTTGIVQFTIISETLQLMLQTKVRSMSQFNIDTTLGSIAITCSRNGPSLNPHRANTIYIHLCHLLRAVLLNHRLKLQGHMHLIVQTVQALLRCLFRPLPHTPPSSKFGAPPPWLSPTSVLTVDAAESFTRLLTLICDPTESSVRGKRHNALVSASEKWKKVAGWHMQFVLMEFVALQLEMRVESAVKEKLIPGIYAIFDTTTIEDRRAMGAKMDASQRAVFGGLVRDYLRFGKWNGA